MFRPPTNPRDSAGNRDPDPEARHVRQHSSSKKRSVGKHKMLQQIGSYLEVDKIQSKPQKDHDEQYDLHYREAHVPQLHDDCRSLS